MQSINFFFSFYSFLRFCHGHISDMALLNIENISNDLPTVFQETISVQPQLDCINAITELKSQLSDNKQHYIFLNQEIKINENKRIEYRHTIKSHIQNSKNLEIFEKKKQSLGN